MIAAISVSDCLAQLGTLLWAMIVLLSLCGWGCLIRSLVPVSLRVEWPVLTALGSCISLFVGGLLALAHWLSPPVTIALTLIGVAVGIPNYKPIYHSSRATISWLLSGGTFFNRALFSSAVLLVGLHIIGETTPFRTVPSDDVHFYYVQLEKMRQTGTIAADPYAERRIGGLAGHAVLLNLMTGVRGLDAVRMFDLGLMLLVYGGLVVVLARTTQTPPVAALAILNLAMLTAPLTLNMTATIDATVLIMLSICVMAVPAGQGKISTAAEFALPGIILGGLIVLKVTYLPIAGFIMLGMLWVSRQEGSFRKWFTPKMLITPMVALAIMAPYMILLKQSSNTFLFPILGKGTHALSYGLGFNEPYTMLTLKKSILAGAKNSFQIVALAAVLAIAMYPKIRVQGIGYFRWLTFGAFLSLVLLETKTHSLYNTTRYTSPIFTPVAIAGVCLLLHPAALEILRKSRFLKLLAASATAVILIWALRFARPTMIYATQAAHRKLHLPEEPYIYSNDAIRRYRAMQATIPEKAKLIAHMSEPSAFDFKRNNIFIWDLPGMSSPPPGTPRDSAESLAAYFKQQGIRYLAYSYATAAGAGRTPEEKEKKLEKFRRLNPWSLHQVGTVFKFQDLLVELGKTRRRLYDDGDMFLLDLETVESPKTSFYRSPLIESVSQTAIFSAL
jgi:hypothetical protein